MAAMVPGSTPPTRLPANPAIGHIAACTENTWVRSTRVVMDSRKGPALTMERANPKARGRRADISQCACHSRGMNSAKGSMELPTAMSPRPRTIIRRGPQRLPIAPAGRQRRA